MEIMKGPGIPRLEVIAMWFGSFRDIKSLTDLYDLDLLIFKDTSDGIDEDHPGDKATQRDNEDPLNLDDISIKDLGDKVNPWDIQRLCRVYIGDGSNVFDASNPTMVDSLYTDLPIEVQDLDDYGVPQQREMMDFTSGHSTGLPGKTEGKRLWHETLPKHTYLQLTGPFGRIIPEDYIDVIVHRGTGDPKLDDIYFNIAASTFKQGRPKTPDDIVRSWTLFDLSFYNRVLHHQVPGPFGCLNLRFIVFKDSKLVTVDAKWFSIGDDGENDKNNATETYICGRFFMLSEMHNGESLLFDTPKNKAIKVAHGLSIPMLRYQVAHPYYSNFKVVASLRDPINNSFVEGSASFDFKHFYRGNVEDYYEEVKFIDGGAAKIQVKVTVKL